MSSSRTSLFPRSSAQHLPGQDSIHCLATCRASDEKPGHSVTISDQFVVVNAHRRTARRIQLGTDGRTDGLRTFTFAMVLEITGQSRALLHRQCQVNSGADN